MVEYQKGLKTLLPQKEGVTQKPLVAVNLHKAYGETVILDKGNLSVNPGDKIGLVGKNGSGKSATLRMLSGREKPDSGMVINPDLKIGYLAQDFTIEGNKTIYEVATEGIQNIKEVLVEFDTMSANFDANDQQFVDRYDKLMTFLQDFGAYEIENMVTSVLTNLGISRNLNTKVSALSGGQTVRLALASILISRPDLLILDEPTNHLDLAANLWLRSFLKEWKGGLLVVSHDRDFLSDVTQATWELEDGTITPYGGNYAFYREQKDLEIEVKEREVVRLSGEIDKVHQQIERETRRTIHNARREKNRNPNDSGGYRGGGVGQRKDKAQKAMGKIKERFLDKEQELKSDLEEVTQRRGAKIIPKIHESETHKGKLLISAKNLTCLYGDIVVVEDVCIDIHFGDKIAIFGNNGAGKSTLINGLIGKNDVTRSGELMVRPDINVQVLDQNYTSVDRNLSVLENIMRMAPNANVGDLRKHLAKFLFRGNTEVNKSASVLSGGEMARLALAIVALQPMDILILDEPTNNLDMNAIMEIETVLKGFKGAVLVVSHDTSFLKNIGISSSYVISDKKITSLNSNPIEEEE